MIKFMFKQVSVVSFGFFVFIDENNTLNAESAFVSLALFNTIKQPMAMLPGTISNLIQVYNSNSDSFFVCRIKI